MSIRLVAAVVLLAILAGTHWKAYVSGKDTVQAAWQKEKQAAEAQAEANRLLAQSSINKTARAYAQQSSKARANTQSNIAKVDDYAPVTSPPLPGTFRLWHDAAATGETLTDPGRADVASVSLKSVAVTVATNYASANYDKQRLEALQQIVKASGCFDVEE